MQNYNEADKEFDRLTAGSFYNAWGLAFVLIFMFLFQVIFYFAGVFTAALIFKLDYQSAQNLLSEPDGTALAINMSRYVNIVSFTGAMLLPALMFSLVNKTGIVREGGLNISIRGSILFLGVLILALALPLADYISEALQSAPLPQNLKHYADYFQHQRNENFGTILDMERPAELVYCLFAIGLLPALFEELLFRGILLKIFNTITARFWTPVLLQAAVFSVLHLSVYELPGIFIMAVIFGIIAQKTGTIWYGIIMHFLFNATSIIVYWMNQETFRETGEYGKIKTLGLTGFQAVLAAVGIMVLLRLLSKVSKGHHHE